MRNSSGTYLRGRGTSLGGLRPKCSVVDDDGKLAIGKSPSVRDERAVTNGEVLAMTLAKAAAARVVDSDGVPVALIRRFDRTPDGRRLMYVSAAPLLGVESVGPLEHSYTKMVDAIRIYGPYERDSITKRNIPVITIIAIIPPPS